MILFREEPLFVGHTGKYIETIIDRYAVNSEIITHNAFAKHLKQEQKEAIEGQKSDSYPENSLTFAFVLISNRSENPLSL